MGSNNTPFEPILFISCVCYWFQLEQSWPYFILYDEPLYKHFGPAEVYAGGPSLRVCHCLGRQLFLCA